MPKVITINGCKDCPYVSNDYPFDPFHCDKFNIPIGDELSETPHPDCKLNDLPSMEFAVNAAMIQSNHIHDLKSVEFGANYILKEITK